MIEVSGNILTYNPKPPSPIQIPDTIEELLDLKPTPEKVLRCIPTSSKITPQGYLSMNTGIAKQAKRKFNELPYLFAQRVDEKGHRLHILDKYEVASFPVMNIAGDLDINLLERSCRELAYYSKPWDYVLLPAFNWQTTKAIFDKHFNGDKFIIVHSYKV